MLVREYCDATRWVLHTGQRDVGIQTQMAVPMLAGLSRLHLGQRDVGIQRGCCDSGQGRGKQTYENPPREVVPGGVGVSLGMVASSLG